MIMPRLKEIYQKDIVPNLKSKFVILCKFEIILCLFSAFAFKNKK